MEKMENNACSKNASNAVKIAVIAVLMLVLIAVTVFLIIGILKMGPKCFARHHLKYVALSLFGCCVTICIVVLCKSFPETPKCCRENVDDRLLEIALQNLSKKERRCSGFEVTINKFK